MKNENFCTHCVQPMDLNHPGYFILEDGAAFHLNCGDEEIEIYTVHWDGELKHLACIEQVVEYVNDLQIDETITIKKRKMSRIEYLLTPEL